MNGYPLWLHESERVPSPPNRPDSSSLPSGQAHGTTRWAVAARAPRLSLVLPLLLPLLLALVGCDEERLERNESCFEHEVSPTSKLVDFMLVVDRSSSMAEVFAPGEPSRFDVVDEALSELVLGAEDRVHFGLALFPSDEGGCVPGGVVVEPWQGSRPEVLDALNPGLFGPLGSSPVAATLGFVRRWADEREGDRRLAVLLATDGAPNCNAQLLANSCECGADDPDFCADVGGLSGNQACLDRDATLSETRRLLADHDAPTFVVGLPGAARFASFLDEVAVAGGTAVTGRGHYPVDQVDALHLALADIEERLGACQLRADTIPFDIDAAAELEVRLGDEPLPRDDGHTDGWDTGPGSQLLLFGPTCERWLGSAQAITVSACR